jgi:type II secretory pathway predicted ATPase ExeA
MYYNHFGLSGPPFDVATPSSLYQGREQTETMAALMWGLQHEPTGYTLLVGEPGTGKTTIINAILAQHRHQIKAAYLNYPKAEAIEVFRNALTQLGTNATQISKYDCVEAFRQRLNRLRDDERLALIFDEAQALSPLFFEELRLLANCISTSHRKVQIVFIGQPSILKRLEAPMLRQLNERIGTRILLHPMPQDDILAYIDHRLRARHGSADQIFGRKALNLVVKHSRGVPRRVNVLCHNSMLSTYASGSHRVGTAMVTEVIKEFEDLLASTRKERLGARAPIWRRFLTFGATAL